MSGDGVPSHRSVAARPGYIRGGGGGAGGWAATGSSRRNGE